MRNFYRIPARFNFIGNKNKGIALIGLGRKVLDDLVAQMGFQNLKTGKRTLFLDDGRIITARIIYGVANVDIVSQPLQEEEIEQLRECFCNCNFSVGIISVVDTSDNKDYYFYNVSACNKRSGIAIYSTFENILGTDFVRWEPGMEVAVLAYNSFLFDCDIGNNEATSCMPVDSDLEHLDEDWRPTYRIIPLCGDSLSRYLNG